jgi:thiamine biosynthesis lipoprotein
MTAVRCPSRFAVARWTALGGLVQLLVRPERLGRGATFRAAELLADVDRRCSRFRPDSDLSRANRNAGAPTEIDGLLHTALDAALDAARTTEGIVDPTLGLVVARLGHGHRAARCSRGPRTAGAALAPSGTWRDVELGDRCVTVPPGLALDLGATGKAFAADLVARTLSRELGADVLVNLGGDVAVAGSADDGWRVGIGETEQRQEEAAGGRPTVEQGEETVALASGGLATSRAGLLDGCAEGGERPHLVDPRTQAPPRPVWRTASVLAGDCVTANTASTAAVILGEQAVSWLASRGLAARLVREDGRVTLTSGWPVPAPRPAGPGITRQPSPGYCAGGVPRTRYNRSR